MSVEELYQVKSYDIGRLLEVPSDEYEEEDPREKPPKDGTNITPSDQGEKPSDQVETPSDQVETPSDQVETPSDQGEKPSDQGETLGGMSDQSETSTGTDQTTGSEKYAKRNEL